MKKLVPSARKSAKNAANLMTADIQQSALENGWAENVAYSTKVMFQNDEYKVDVSEKLNSQALDLEYGTTKSRPTAVLRKYSNNTSKIESSIVRGIEKELGWRLT